MNEKGVAHLGQRWDRACLRPPLERRMLGHFWNMLRLYIQDIPGPCHADVGSSRAALWQPFTTMNELALCSPSLWCHDFRARANCQAMTLNQLLFTSWASTSGCPVSIDGSCAPIKWRCEQKGLVSMVHSRLVLVCFTMLYYYLFTCFFPKSD